MIFFVIQQPGQSWTEQDFINLTAVVGVPWSLEKLRPLASVQRYIGFDWHLVTRAVSIPLEKLERIQALIQQWLTAGFKASARDAASLHGKLVHIAGIYYFLRPFLRSIALFPNHFHSTRAHLYPPPLVLADLRWILDLIDIAPNSYPLLKTTPEDLGWWGDASTSFGIGITVGGFWAVWKWASGVTVGPKQRFDIGWAEAVAVELALHAALHLHLLPPGHFLVRSDNAGVVSVLSSGRSRSHETNTILKTIFVLLTKHRIRLRAVHVPSRFNVTDALSRGDIPGFLKGFPSAHTKCTPPLPFHLAGLLVPL